MEETYGLTRTEMEIMEYLWKKGATAPFREQATSRSLMALPLAQ